MAVDFKLNSAQQRRPSANRLMIAAAPRPDPSPVLHAPHPPSAPQVHVPKQYARPPPAVPTSMPVQPAAVPVARPAVPVARPAVQHPRPSPPSNTNMVTLLSRVKWYDGAKGIGFTVPLEAGRPEVFVTQGDVQAAGIATLRGGMNVMVTFDASRPKPKALVLQLPP
jgi:cold shock CspA family protein